MREFTTDRRRRSLLRAAGSLAGLGILAGCTGSPSDDPGGSGSSGTPTTTAGGNTAWRTTELTDVLTGETFTIGGLEPPVLVQNFAVWCPKCARQSRNIRKLLTQRDDVTAVSLNVDPNEDADAVREHARSEEFDWPFAVASPSVSESLKTTFGTTALNPPSAPVIRVCADSATLLQSRVKSVETLAESLQAC